MQDLPIIELYKMQEHLDSYIEQKHKSLSQSKTLEKRWIALLVELSELANETRCFKYWSLKSASSKDVILEEYVDGIHFILSIGNKINQTRIIPILDKVNLKFENKDIKNNTLTEKFQELFAIISECMVKTNLLNHQLVLKKYLELGKLLNFSSQDIFNAYIAKNKINFQRQDTNY